MLVDLFLYRLKNVWIRENKNSECVRMVMKTNNGKTNDVGCDQRNTAYVCEKPVKGMIFFLNFRDFFRLKDLPNKM